MTSKLSVIAAATVLLQLSAATASQIRPGMVGTAAAHARFGTSLVPPVKPACISSPFGPRILPNQPQAGTYHYGIDLPAADGAAVFASASGTVIRIQNKGPGGLEMLVQHQGFVGVYSHFGMVMPAFAAGKLSVSAGEKLGVVGTTGMSSGPHLYFGMLLDGQPVDPAQYLAVPLCTGGFPRPQTDRVWGNGLTVEGRKYYQLFMPERQYYQWRQN